jgi:hypothetical protein
MANCGQRADGTTPNFTTTGLTNSGGSTYYQVQYDDEITSTSAQAAFETFRKNCDADFVWMQKYFNNAASPWSGQMQINIVSGNDAPAGGGVGACWNSTSGPITLYPGVAANSSSATVDSWFLRYLLVSEVVEMFMESTGSDWYGGNWSGGGDEGSAGEGLSRFFGTQLLLQVEGASGGYSGFAVANQWMSSARSDYVNNVSASDNSIDPVIGCAAIFVYYLYTQLGCPIQVMTANGAKELSGVYANITGDQNDPFPYFKNLVDIGYPGTATITGPNLDNPWPIATVSFVGVKSTYGADESKDIIHSQSGLVSNAFTLWIDGLSRASFAGLNIEVSAFSGSFANLSGVKIKPNPVGPQFESGVSQYAPQRIQIPYDVVLSTPFLGHFPSKGTTPFGLSVSLTSGSTTVTASQAATEIELIAGADPYFTNLDSTNSNYPYLSQDLRLFTVTPGINATPIPGVPALADSVTGAYSYVQAVLNHLNDPVNGFTNPSGPDPFTTVLPTQGDWDQADSSVYPWTFNLANFGIDNNYSFAIARVRLRGSSGAKADNVRVFFRLFATQSNDTDYDPNGTYAFSADSAGLPGSPKVGAGNTTFPFFATANFASQTDYTQNGANNQTLTIPDNSDSLWAYYGCFLNLYDQNNTFNNQQIQTYLAGSHHCLVAQIAFDDAPIPTGVSPLSWDQLAQRNLQFTASDNPGPASTHRVPQTFDCRPSKGYSPALNGVDTVYPDELMIDWGRIPTGSVASLYWPQVLASDVVGLARKFYGATPLSAADAHTIQIPIAGGLSYVPIPTGAGQNFAGLFTVDLPQSSVHTGESFDITVKRVGTKSGPVPPPPPPPPPPIQIQAPAAASKTGKSTKAHRATHGEDAKRSAPPAEIEAAEFARTIRWRYVIGTFQVHIPVATGEQILPSEETLLAIMKWRLEQMSPSNRWYPVLIRYIDYIAARIDGLGGDAKSIPPSLSGFLPVPEQPCKAREFTGKICEVLFDCHGDFDGFVLDDCCESHLFRSRAEAIGKLALWACQQRMTVSVCEDHGPNRKIRSLVVKGS